MQMQILDYASLILAGIILAVVGFVMFRAVRRLIYRYVEEELAKKASRSTGLLIMFILLIVYAFQIIQFFGVVVDTQTYITALAVLVIGVLAIRIIVPVTEKQLQRLLPRSTAKALAKLLTYFAILIVVFLIAGSLGIDLTGVALGGTAVAIAIAFAAQQTFSNFISGLFLFGDRTFNVGDVVLVQGYVGIIEEIGLIHTVIRLFDNTPLTVPNTVVLNETRRNYYSPPATPLFMKPDLGVRVRGVFIPCSVSYFTNLKAVEKVWVDMASSHPKVMKEPRPNVFWKGFGESGIDFELRCFTEPESWRELNDYFTKEIKERFEKEHLEIPFPHRTIYIEKMPSEPNRTSKAGSKKKKKGKKPL